MSSESADAPVVPEAVRRVLPVARAREHAEAIVAAMAEGYTLTVDARIEAVNDALCAMTGFSREELVGTVPPYPFCLPEMLTDAAGWGNGVIDAEADTFGLAMIRKDGTQFDAELTARPARDPDGTVLGYVTTFRDVSERNRYEAEILKQRRALADSEARLRAFIEHAPAAIVMRDLDGRYEYVNAATGAALGYAPTELVGRSSYDSHPPEIAAAIRAEDERMIRERVGSTKRSPVTLPDGAERLYEITRYPVLDADGGPIALGSFSLDITDRAQRDAEERALRAIAELVARGAGPASVFSAVAGHVRDLFGAYGGVVARFDAAAGVATLVSGSTERDDSATGMSLPLDGASAAAMVFRSGRPARLDTPHPSDGDPAAALFRPGQIRGAVAAPIIVKGQLWGALGASFTTKPVPDGAERRLEMFAQLVAMAIANADAWDTLSREAATDPLTGLANHRVYGNRLGSELQRARRYHRDLSLVLLDLDRFKEVNDALGHQAGDRVLVEVARRLRTVARESELVARIGGEEFAWVMPETDQHGAYQAAERFRRAIETEPVADVGRITVSAGVCAFERGMGVDDLVRFADRALYWAKDSGRNTTFLYTEETQAVLARRMRTVERFQSTSSVRALARAIDSKDPSTREHSERVAALAERLALHLGWTSKRARLLHACGQLHDVGKIGIPDEILLKPGPLTAAEYEQVKRHAEIGAQIAAEFLEPEQASWIRGHHEWWDGTGYPDRLAGEEIPDGAQLLALADAWDVMTVTRTYKSTKTVDEALAEVRAQAGHQFASGAVRALVTITASPAARR